jgi:hypothetical protein
MKANVKFSLNVFDQEIDLEYYGHGSETTWDDLTEDQQHEIEDSLREENMIIVSIENIQ